MPTSFFEKALIKTPKMKVLYYAKEFEKKNDENKLLLKKLAEANEKEKIYIRMKNVNGVIDSIMVNAKYIIIKENNKWLISLTEICSGIGSYLMMLPYVFDYDTTKQILDKLTAFNDDDKKILEEINILNELSKNTKNHTISDYIEKIDLSKVHN